jgi:hypothetical protein
LNYLTEKDGWPLVQDLEVVLYQTSVAEILEHHNFPNKQTKQKVSEGGDISSVLFFHYLTLFCYPDNLNSRYYKVSTAYEIKAVLRYQFLNPPY